MAGDRRLVLESPEMYETELMQAYIAQEVSRPCKQWVHEVIHSKREADRVKLRTEHFVLLPDADSLNRKTYSRVVWERPDGSAPPCYIQDSFRFRNYYPASQSSSIDTRFSNNFNPLESKFDPQSPPAKPLHAHASPTLIPRFKLQRDISPTPNPMSNANQDPMNASSSLGPPQPYLCSPQHRWRIRRGTQCLHWLAVVTDTQLKTIRDLRGSHIPMLQKLYAQCCHKIFEETGIAADQIMAYVHYPPSVYQLHIHFKHPIGQHVSHDTFRIHSIPSIINNLKIDPNYYSKSLLQLPVYAHTELYTALGLKAPQCAPTTDKGQSADTVEIQVEIQTEA